MQPSRIAVALGMWIAAAGVPPPASAGTIALGDALSRIDIMCMSVQGTAGSFAQPMTDSCEEHPSNGSSSGTTRATLSAEFGDLLMTSVSTDCVSCPFAPSTRSSSRISFELAVVQHASPPHPLTKVPVRITAEGAVGVSQLGFIAGGGTYLSSTLQTIFTNADVFAHTMLTFSQGGVGPFLSDDYAITDTLDLIPEQVYFGNTYVGCNQNSSAPGDWACSGHSSVSFVLDQAAFDATMGGQTFDLSQYVSIERSPNLVPEPPAQALGAASLGAIALAARGRRFLRGRVAAILRA